MVAKVNKKGCCEDVLSLPEEMRQALNENGGLEGLRSKIPGRTELASEAKRFQVLSEPIRLQILHSLMICDLCPCVLREITGLSDSKLSYHLNILEEEGLIKSSPRHRWRIYLITEHGRAQLQV